LFYITVVQSIERRGYEMTITAWGITLADLDVGQGILFATKGPLEKGGKVTAAVIVEGKEYLTVKQELHDVSSHRLAESPTIDWLLF